jgi:hypothetical protein
MLRRSTFVLFACLSLMACRHPVPAGTGISGVVRLGPTCPVETVTSPCPDSPFRGDVMATASDGASTTVTTDGEGRFTMNLRAGTYVVTAVATSGSIPPTPAPQTVQVRDGSYTRVTLEVDTGIR